MRVAKASLRQPPHRCVAGGQYGPPEREGNPRLGAREQRLAVEAWKRLCTGLPPCEGVVVATSMLSGGYRPRHRLRELHGGPKCRKISTLVLEPLMDRPLRDERSLHGGPVPAWPRRTRSLVHWCGRAIATTVLAGLITAVGFICADAFGELGPTIVTVSLMLTAIMAYLMVGRFTPTTVALTCATALMAVSQWLGRDFLLLLILSVSAGL